MMSNFNFRKINYERLLNPKFIGLVVLLAAVIGVVAYLLIRDIGGEGEISVSSINGDSSIWKYECIDTMKTSRDKARAWGEWEGLEEHIESEMKAIEDMGADCVAIDTPYDEEFLPYLRKWVDAARERDLRIWYRGNFSSWEGWFEYPEDMSADELFSRTSEFILSNPELFQDGDIFTPAPEAENGGLFNQVEEEEHSFYRQFLEREYFVVSQAFEDIGRDVAVNWMSMNGGLARRMMNQETVDVLDGVVTIDHYIRTAPEMGEYIEYFADNFGAKVVVGEFGAPIPDINGSMNPVEQAEFVEELFAELYRHREDVVGVNYWTLYDGSTALLNSELETKPVAEVVRRYFRPIEVRGSVKGMDGEGTSSQITVDELDETFFSDDEGNFEFLLPRGEYVLTFSTDKHRSLSTELSGEDNGYEFQVELEPIDKNIMYNIRSFFRSYSH